MTSKYSKLQWLSLFLYSSINTLCALISSLHAPFYPIVAGMKGVMPAQYGYVFGAFSLTLFVMCLLASVIISRFGAAKVGVLGVFIIGSTSILFGLVDKINNPSLFTGISVLIRIFEGFGYSMARNASIAIVSFEFSSNVEMAFAFIQAFFNAGVIIGPVVGGTLFELGGFILPFVVVGALILFTDIMILFFTTDCPKQEAISFMQILRYLRIPSTILGSFVVFDFYLTSGFLLSTFEPHVKNLNLSPFEIGLMFLCNGISSSSSIFVWSKLCKKYDIAMRVGALSSIILTCSLIIMGPAPYLPFDNSIYTCIFGMILHGIGQGGGQMSGFSILKKSARIAGLKQDIQTSANVSCIFTSSLSLGYFIGSILGGYLFDVFDFPWGSHFFILFNVIVLFVIIVCLYIWGGDLKTQENTNILISSETILKYKSLENN